MQVFCESFVFSPELQSHTCPKHSRLRRSQVTLGLSPSFHRSVSLTHDTSSKAAGGGREIDGSMIVNACDAKVWCQRYGGPLV